MISQGQHNSKIVEILRKNDLEFAISSSSFIHSDVSKDKRWRNSLKNLAEKGELTEHVIQVGSENSSLWRASIYSFKNS